MNDTIQDAAATAPKKAKKGLIIGISLAVVALALGAVVFILYNQRNLTEQERQQIINSGTFHDGITVNSVPVGGLTIEGAAEKLKDAEQSLLSGVNYTLTYGDKEYTLTAADFGVTFNTQEVLSEAMLVAREGSLEELKAEIADIAAGGKDFSIDYTLDPAPVKAKIEQIAAELNSEPVNAILKSHVSQATAEELENAAATQASGAAETVETSVQASPAPDQDQAAQTGQETIINGQFVYLKEKEGIAVDQDALYQSVSAMAAEKQFGAIEIPVTNTPAAITVDLLSQTLVLRGSYSTSYGHAPYNRSTRVYNLNKASGIINGTVLKPGDIFSANGTLGDRTYAAGWKPAPAIIDGGADTEDQAGGGVCQISSTLYVAALQSDLEIVYRQPHSSKLGYIPGGLDATIDSGRIDFKFKNNTNSDLYIFMWVDKNEKKVHAEIYGEPMIGEYDKIVASSKKVSSLSPGADVYTTDKSLPAGSIVLVTERKSGSVWQSYLTYYKDGIEVKTVELAISKYPAHPNKYSVGPGYTPGSTPAPNPGVSSDTSGDIGTGLATG
ncbi:MAG: VanW family protein [Bacillota bacterium]